MGDVNWCGHYRGSRWSFRSHLAQSVSFTVLLLVFQWTKEGFPGRCNLRASVATNQRDHPAKSPLAIEFMEAEDVGPARKDELKAVPTFNYSRAFTCPLSAEEISWLVKNAAANAEQGNPVSNLVGREAQCPTRIESGRSPKLPGIA